MQKRRKSSRRRTSVRQRRFSTVEKADNHFLEKSDRISSAFIVFAPNKSPNHTFIRFFGLRFFSRPEMGRDKIVWSVRFRRARRTIVRRAAKSGAEKAKTLNFKQESVRIPDTWARGEIKKMQKRLKSSRRRTSVRHRRF